MEIHKKFSIPFACIVFTLVGVGLGSAIAKTASSPASSSASRVIFTYYVIMFTSEAMTKGAMMPASLAMWVPNILLGRRRHRAAPVSGAWRRPVASLSAAAWSRARTGRALGAFG